MTDEPSKVIAEPVGATPLGASGTQATEPAKTDVEPSKEVSEPAKQAEPQTEEFTNLKEVPPQLQGAAKKIQADLTRRAQALAEREKELSSLRTEKPVERQELSPEAAEIRAYMATPQGGALKDVFREMVHEEVGDLPQRVYTQEADKEIEAAVSKYGEDNIKANYAEIQARMADHPEVPLDMIMSNVFYEKAKSAGQAELRQKLEDKKNRSLQLGTTTPVVSKDAAVNSFDDAFKKALEQHRAA